MKLKLMIALVIMALVFGMVLIACDDGDAPDIKEATKDVSGAKVKTETIYDINLLGTYDDDPTSPNYGKYTAPKADTTENAKKLDNDGNPYWELDFPGAPAAATPF